MLGKQIEFYEHKGMQITEKASVDTFVKHAPYQGVSSRDQ